MKVSELAKELNTTSDDVLSKLKSLKLKAKDSKQELNSVVVSVLKREFKKSGIAPKKAAQKSSAKEVKKETKEKKVKKAAKSKTTKAAKEEKPKEKAPKAKKTAKKKEAAPKKAVKKKVAKKKTAAASKATKERTKKEPEAPEKAKPKAKPKISSQGFVTLKPLSKKRKKKPSSADTEPEASSSEAATPPSAEASKPLPAEPPAVEQVAQEVPEVVAENVDNLPVLELKVPISVKDFSVRIQQKPSIVLKRLMQMGVFANINLGLEEDVVRKLSSDFGFFLSKVKTQEQQLIEAHKEEEENPDLLKPRAPVVTFMGHVDHGKTSLLDKIRKSKIADKEHGGITQHMGAYSVDVPKGRIVFLDTPGHEAFTSMRARGAHITDIVILVVAADEGIMPQTEEAIDHARAADVPIVVALNKIDRRNADPDRVKKQLAQKGLNPEDWGGDTIVAGVSAVTGEGIDDLLESILLESEMLELKANSEKKAAGIVVEAHLSRGKGAVADLIVQSGTLREGDIIVVGPYYGKLKAMFNDYEKIIKEAGPSMPVEVLGLPGVPEAGEIFYAVDDEKQAKEITSRRQEQIKNEKLGGNQKVTLEDLYSQIQQGDIKELNVILKADVQGSLEALKDSLEKIPSDEVKIKFIHTGVGEVNISDVLLAVASNAIIICFHVGAGPQAAAELEKQPVDVRKYRVIYDAVNDIRNALEGLLEPKTKKKFLSRIEIREVFKLSKSGIVAGCFVQKGKVHRKANIDIMRNGELVFSGTISSLKRFKDDVRDVGEGMECGITIKGFDKIQAGDIIEAYEVEVIQRKL